MQHISSTTFSVARPALFTTLLTALLFAFCGNAWAQKTPRGQILWQKDYEYVSLVPSDGRPSGRHPVDISPRSLQRALRSLRVKSASGLFTDRSKQVPVFTQSTANLLGKHLTAALRRAKRGQDVLFRVGDLQSFIGVVNRAYYTAGRVFWFKDRLHIIFGGIHNSTSKRTLFGQDETTQIVGEPEEGSRTKEAELNYIVVAARGIAYAKKNRRDWIAIRPSQVKVPSAGGDSGARADIETRLRKLQRLYDKGLISRREYRARKRELLDDI